MRRLLIYLLVFTFVGSAYMDDADAKKRRRRPRAKKLKIINEKRLYERLGNANGVSGIVDEWVRINIADPRLATAFATTTASPDKLAKFRRALNEEICELSDGPCRSKTPEGKKSFDGLPINDEQFLVAADNLFKSLQKFSVPEREKNEMLGRLAELRPDAEY